MAYSAPTTYFANKGTLSIVGVGGTPAAVIVAIVKDVEINWSVEHVPLYGWGSIKRQAMARHSMKVDVKVGYVKFAPDISGATWWPMHVISPTAGSVSSGTEDTNTVKYFDITAKFTGENGDTFTGIVKNVAFTNFPLKASEAQWIKVDMDGQGDDIQWNNT